MKTTVLPLLCIALSGCSHSSPPMSPSKEPGANSTTFISPRADPPRIYHLKNGSTIINSGLGIDLDALNHVTILGAVKHPGVYYFEGRASLEDIINSAKPFLNSEGSVPPHGRANLTKIRILSASMDGVKIPGPLVVDYPKYSAPAATGETIKKRISLSGGVIYIHESFQNH